MKLLFANHQLAELAGSELHTVDLCRGFRRAGHEVSVFTLEPGTISDMLEDEGVPLYTLENVESLYGADFDLIYLHQATCEVFLGLIFAGRVPIVRGFVSKGGASSNPTNGSFLSGAVYLSEGIREATSYGNENLPSMIARNVYDERQVPDGVEFQERPSAKPNFAVVTNHLMPELANLLEEAATAGQCRFTHFGQPDNSVPVTAELLAPFDAVVTIGRTVIFAAALGKPVYICDIFGAEGWLTPENYGESRQHSFSGRRATVQDWEAVKEQLLDVERWPSATDRRWLRERVQRDYALSRRVKQLEEFFEEIIRSAPPPEPVPDGYKGVLYYVANRHRSAAYYGQRVRDLTGALKHEKQQRQDLRRRLQQERRRSRDLEREAQSLRQRLREIEDSYEWQALKQLSRLKNSLLRK